jgi:hypothetical protein
VVDGEAIACDERGLSAIKHRPRIRLTIRQRTRVLQQWPEE